jgi:hypothetical protein
MMLACCTATSCAAPAFAGFAAGIGAFGIGACGLEQISIARPNCWQAIHMAYPEAGSQVQW